MFEDANHALPPGECLGTLQFLFVMIALATALIIRQTQWYLRES
jgi:hypothetical protein